MKIDVYFTPAEVVASDLGNRSVAVIDVLRATSTITEALVNGARAVFVSASSEDAVRIGQAIGRENTLLAGERRCLPIEGFDLGNSPREMTCERVADRSLIMTTTNGTAALLLGASGRETLVASFLNLNAVARALANGGGPVTILCAGREKRFALEDAVCAGALVRAIRSITGAKLECNDAALAAERMADIHPGALEALMRETAAGRQLESVGLGDDVSHCARIDIHSVVPRLEDRQITLQ